MHRHPWAICLFTLAGLGACGGGGESTTMFGSPAGQVFPPQPTASGTAVLANVYSNPANSPTSIALLGAPSVGTNTVASVYVGDYALGSAISTASVSVNGVSLPFDTTRKAYVGSLTVGPGAKIEVSVNVGGKAYASSTNQLSTLQSITAPARGSSVPSTATLNAAWTTPTADLSLLLWAEELDTGKVIWPASIYDDAADVSGKSSAAIPVGALPAGSVLISLLAAKCVAIQGAAGSSGLCVGAVQASRNQCVALNGPLLGTVRRRTALKSGFQMTFHCPKDSSRRYDSASCTSPVWTTAVAKRISLGERRPRVVSTSTRHSTAVVHFETCPVDVCRSRTTAVAASDFFGGVGESQVLRWAGRSLRNPPPAPWGRGCVKTPSL